MLDLNLFWRNSVFCWGARTLLPLKSCMLDSGNVTCLDSQEIELPLVVPQWTNTLILRGINISALPESAFLVNGTDLEFKTLQLSWNNIREFDDVRCPTGCLRNLQRLDLSGNRLKAIPIARFDNLNLNTLVLTNNSIENIGGNNVSKTKRGLPVEKLLMEDINCINAELETVSYVFLETRAVTRMEVYHYRYEQDSDPRLET
uniref:Uncharacterized protein n=1 Tax=Electrophorus electricus TaxID=8005 RepID=A0AAY5F5R7_ELEEL